MNFRDIKMFLEIKNNSPKTVIFYASNNNYGDYNQTQKTKFPIVSFDLLSSETLTKFSSSAFKL